MKRHLLSLGCFLFPLFAAAVVCATITKAAPAITTPFYIETLLGGAAHSLFASII
jgi:hypothetical protein